MKASTFSSILAFVLASGCVVSYFASANELAGALCWATIGSLLATGLAHVIELCALNGK